MQVSVSFDCTIDVLNCPVRKTVVRIPMAMKAKRLIMAAIRKISGMVITLDGCEYLIRRGENIAPTWDNRSSAYGSSVFSRWIGFQNLMPTARTIVQHLSWVKARRGAKIARSNTLSQPVTVSTKL